MIWIIWTILRLTVPLSILRWPLFGVLLSSYLDLSDYFYLSQTGVYMSHYQTWDKILDTFYLAIAAYTCLSWKDVLAKKVALFSFYYRFIGVFLAIILNFRGLLFFFPNFFENFFIFYLIYKKFRKEDLFINKKVAAVVIAAILLPKLLQEYSMHLVQAPPTQIFDLSKLPTIGEYLPRPPETYVQVMMFFTLPIIALIWRLRTAKK